MIWTNQSSRGATLGSILLILSILFFAGTLHAEEAYEKTKKENGFKTGFQWIGKQYWDPAPGNELPNLFSMTGTAFAVLDRVSTDQALKVPGAVETNLLFRDKSDGAKWGMSQALNFGRNSLLRHVWKDERKWVKGLAAGIWIVTLGLEVRAISNNYSVARLR